MSFQQQEDTQSGSFHSDNTVTAFRLISAIAAVTVATSSVLLWRVRSLSPAEAKHHPKPLAPVPSSFLIPSRTGALIEPILEGSPSDVATLQGPIEKTSRSKERRRRGKDLFKELSKGGKKHKELHRQLNSQLPTSLRDPTALQAEQGHPHPEPSPEKSNGPSRVQISGPSQVREFDAINTPRPSIDKPPDDTVNRSLAGEFELSAVTAKKERPVEDSLPPHEVVSPDGITVPEEPNTSQGGSGNASTDHLVTPSRGLDSHTEGFSSSSNPPSHSQGRPHSGITGDSCHWDGQPSSCQEPTPRFAAVRVSSPQSGLGTSICSPVSFSSTDTPSTLSDIFPSIPFTYPTPPPRVGARRAPISHAPPCPSPNLVSAQTQIASLRGALEAARLREEKSRMEAECRAKEYDVLRQRWMEEIARQQHREAQLHAYIQYLTHVLQMYAGAYPSFLTRVPIVPALVTSTLPGAVHSITMHQFHNSVLDNTRGRRRKREVQDDGVVGNPNMDVLLCNEVAGAILKRPESLRTEIQPRPPRFSSLPHMGQAWYVGGTEELSGVVAEGGGENEAVGEENDHLRRENPPPGEIAEMDITKVKTHVDQ